MKRREMSDLQEISEQDLEEGEIKDENEYYSGESVIEKDSATTIDIFNSQFMVLDSIECDEVFSTDEKILDSEDEQENEIIGEEFCKLVYYCELCSKRINSEENGQAIRLHCLSQPHRNNYAQYQKAKLDKIVNYKRARYTKYFIEKDHDNEK